MEEMKFENKLIDLAERRKEKGLTQKQLAQKCNVGVSTIKKWEKRKGNIKRDDLMQYSKVLNLNPMEIIDPEHEFLHYDDNPYELSKLPTIDEIRNICMRLIPDRIHAMYMFGSGQLDEQANQKVTYGLLKKNIRHHDLKIDGEIYSGSEINMFPTEDKYLEDFFGILPFDYTMSLKVVGDELFPLFKDGQKIFIKAVNSEVFSGNFVIAEKNEHMYIRQFRATGGAIYLFPLSRANEKIDSGKDKYMMSADDGWEILYSIKLSSY